MAMASRKLTGRGHYDRPTSLRKIGSELRKIGSKLGQIGAWRMLDTIT